MECEDHAAYFGGMLVLHLVEVITQGFGVGNVSVDLRFQTRPLNGGGFGGEGLGLRAGTAKLAGKLRWDNLSHLSFGFNRQRTPNLFWLAAECMAAQITLRRLEWLVAPGGVGGAAHVGQALHPVKTMMVLSGAAPASPWQVQRAGFEIRPPAPSFKEFCHSHARACAREAQQTRIWPPARVNGYVQHRASTSWSLPADVDPPGGQQAMLSAWRHEQRQAPLAPPAAPAFE